MSASCYGFGNSVKPRDLFLEGCENSSNSDYEDIISPETSPLRGFDKIPTVLIPRLKIESYINKYESFSDCVFKESNSDQAGHRKLDTISQIQYNCSVRLVRDKLEQLKKDILENSRINKSRYNGNLNMMLHCKICEKAYSSEKKLQNHQENKHMLVYKAKNNKPPKRVSFSDHIIVHELKEYHRCRKCPKIFEDYRSLKSHMKQKHKKRKCYICHYCSKNFVDRMFFKVHIKLHCDKCGMLLENKSKYLYHRRYTCKVPKKYKCKTCYNSFFSYMDLKDHSYDHLEQLFICDICKEQSDSKCAISHHISFLHSEKRPRALYIRKYIGNNRLYLCNTCDYSSTDRQVIKKHVSVLPNLTGHTHTGYTDFYFCDQCLMKFDTETRMLHHKWSHFLNTHSQDHSQYQDEQNVSKPELNVKSTYRASEKLPAFMQPTIVIERLNLDKYLKKVEPEDKSATDVYVQKEKVTTQPKKALLRQYECEMCSKNYTTNSNLTRHVVTVHSDYHNLRCKHCEETFVWPSLLKSHRCLRMNIPEMPFDDARPEIQFDNYVDLGQNGFDELMNISDSDDYMNSVDFDIPAPALHQYNSSFTSPVNSGCRVVIQEVPIEF